MTAFDAVHARLREIMLHAGHGQVIAVDEPGQLVLRTAAIDPKTGEPSWFGTVTTKKSYVAYHLMPLYTDAALGNGISDELSRRRQGKTCFNFRNIDEALFAELSALTRRANRD